MQILCHVLHTKLWGLTVKDTWLILDTNANNTTVEAVKLCSIVVCLSSLIIGPVNATSGILLLDP